jgi:hypothetical protein
MRAPSFIVPLAAYALGACSDSGSPNPTVIHLTQAQATAVVSGVSQVAALHPEIAFLADSAGLVLKSGAEADAVNITTDLGAGPFYAVALQVVNVVTGSNNFISTTNSFYFIAFNNPSNPTDFIVIDGFKQNNSSTIPTEASAAFGGSTVVGHMFHIDGGTIAAYRATTGSAALTSGSPGASCDLLPLPSNVTCAQTSLQATFSIIQADRDNGGVLSGHKAASLSQTTVAGIRFMVTKQI